MPLVRECDEALDRRRVRGVLDVRRRCVVVPQASGTGVVTASTFAA